MRGLLIIALVMGLTACVTTTVYKDMTMLGKDKAIGRVQMGFSYDSVQIPVANHALAMAEVEAQCRDWQYVTATLLQGMDHHCIAGTETSCERYQVVYSYQCLTAEDVKNYQEGHLDFTNKQTSTTPQTTATSTK